MKLKIHMIRHGTTEGNLKRWYYGSLDIPLAPEGVAQVKDYVAQGIYPRPASANYYTSGLMRAEETFSLIYGDEDREIFPAFREVDFGIFEGKNHEELKTTAEYRKWIGDKSRNSSPPKGESIVQFKERVLNGLNQLIVTHEKDEHVVVVCHGGVIGTVMNSVFPNKREHFFQWIPEPGRGFALVVGNGKSFEFKEI